MLELGTFGSVRGVSGNGHPYRNPRSQTAARAHPPGVGNTPQARIRTQQATSPPSTDSTTPST